MRRLTLLGLLIVLMSAAGPVHAQDPTPDDTPEPTGEPVSGENLLVNPSFEWPDYYEWVEPGVGNGFIANGWVHWFHLDENGKDGKYKVPEWKPVLAEREPVRVVDGESAQVYFKKWAYHIAGLYQNVDVPANSTLRFTAWGTAWSTHIEPPLDQYNSFAGGEPNYVFMKVGIDPTGGTNWASGDIVWSEIKTPLDTYDEFIVEAIAQGDNVTVWLWSSPQYPASTVDVFWDDSSLVVTAEGVPNGGDAAPSGDADTVEGVVPATPQAVSEDGAQYHVVQPLDTIIRIAAAYDVSPDRIRELNNLTSDVLFVDQELIILTAQEVAQRQEPETAGTPEALNEEQDAPAAEEAAQICLLLFEDADGDGAWGQGEAVIENGNLLLEGQLSTSQFTQAGPDPTCLVGLPPGDYTLAVAPPEGYSLANGSAPLTLSLSEGSEIALNVAASPLSESPESPTPLPAPTTVTEEADTDDRRSNTLVIGLAIAGFGLVVTSGITAWIVMRGSRPA